MGLSRIETLINHRIVTVGLLLVVVFKLALIAALLFFHFEAFNFIEFEIVSFAMLLGRGDLPYRDIATHIMPIGYYTPLCYWTPALLGKVFNVLDDPHAFLMTFRALIYFYTTGIAFLAFLIARQLSKSVSVGLFVLTAILSPPWSPLGVRPDWAPFFFSVIAFWLIVKSQQRSVFLWIVCGVLFAVSFLHLQRYFALYVAVFAVLMLQKQIKNAIFLGSAFTLTLIVVMLPIYISTKGNAIDHFITLPAVVSVPGHLYKGIFRYGVGFPFYIMAFGALAALPSLLQKSLFNDRVLVAYAVICLVWTLYTMRSIGASTNQVLELVFIMALLVAAGWGHCASVFLRWILFLAILVIPLYCFVETVSKAREVFLGLRVPYDQTLGYEEIIRSLPAGPMLSDDTVLPYRANHPEASVEVAYYTDFLIPQGRFDVNPTIERLKSKSYKSLVFTRGSNLFKIFEDVINQGYIQTREFGKYVVWEPVAD